MRGLPWDQRAARLLVQPLAATPIRPNHVTCFTLVLALIGAGMILSLPVIVQRSVIVNYNYGMGATLAVILLTSVILINLFSVWMVHRFRQGKTVTI